MSLNYRSQSMVLKYLIDYLLHYKLNWAPHCFIIYTMFIMICICHINGLCVTL